MKLVKCHLKQLTPDAVYCHAIYKYKCMLSLDVPHQKRLLKCPGKGMLNILIFCFVQLR